MNRAETRLPGLLAALALLLLASAAAAEVEVVIAYDTQAVGEIEPCG